MTTSKSILLASVILASAGCNDFLTPEPKTFITPDNYYKTPGHMEQAVTAVYVSARDMITEDNDWREIGSLRGDLATLQFNVNIPGFTFQIDEFSEATNDGVINDHYNRTFVTILDANVVLSRIENVEFEDEAQKERIRAEALFGRAFAYWQALQLWGLGESWEPENLAVPLIVEEITHPDEAFLLERATVQQVFDQIVEDLTQAKQNLPEVASGGGAGRFTRGAATFLLGATYQLDPSQASQEAALAEFAELESLGYGLVMSGTSASGGNAYREIFNPSNKNNIESILEFQFDVGFDDESLRQDMVPGMAPLNSAGGGNDGNPDRIAVYGAGGEGDFSPTQNHILSFAGADPAGPEAPFDLRYEGGYGQFCPESGVSGRLGDVPDLLRESGDITVRSPNSSYPELNLASVRDPVNRSVRTDCIPYFAKWRWPEHMPQVDRDNNNWIMFRYADALLRRAESLARLGRPDEARGFVDQVDRKSVV